MHFVTLKRCLQLSAFFAFLIPNPATLAADANHDGMDDIWQQRYGIAPFTGSANPDGDARINLVEAINFSDPHNGTDGTLGMVMITDLDLDGLADVWQAQHQITAAQALDDPDGDGRKNIEESIVYSDPHTADTPWGGAQGHGAPQSGSGPVEFTLTLPYTAPGLRYTLEYSTDLLDYQTAAAVPDNPGWGNGGPRTDTCPTGGAGRMFFRYRIDNPDEDNDGVSTWHELFVLGSDPEDADSDGDGINDGVELAAGSSPTNPLSLPGSAPPAPTGLNDSEIPTRFIYQYGWVLDSWNTTSGTLSRWDMVTGFNQTSYSGGSQWGAALGSLAFPSTNPIESQPWIDLNIGTCPATACIHYQDAAGGYFDANKYRVVWYSPQPVTELHRRIFREATITTDLATDAKTCALLNAVELVLEPTSGQGRYSNAHVLEPQYTQGKKIERVLTPNRFAAPWPGNGFDDTMVPPCQSVPLTVPASSGGDEERWVHFEVAPGLEDQFEFAATPNGRLEVDVDPLWPGTLLLKLDGLTPGPATVYAVWKPTMTAIAALSVDVLRPTTRQIFLWRVAPLNGNGPTNVPTASDLQNYLNSVWGTQANAWFTVTDKGDHVVDFESWQGSQHPNVDGKVQRNAPFDPTLNGEMDRIWQAHGSPSVINLYFVNALNPSGAGGVSVNDKIIFVQDNTSPGEKKYVVAHEVGHSLGVVSPEHNNISKKNLMYYQVQASNPTEIRKVDWKQVKR